MRARAIAALAAAFVAALAAPAPASAATWPTATGAKTVTSTIPVSGVYDGGLKRFTAVGLGTGDQDEHQEPIFELADGATLKNVIIGAPGVDGVHCLGSCTIQNVWWEDVGEDAATFLGKSSSSVYTVYGGGARHAGDKIFQFNGAGKLVITKFDASDFKTFVRSCGNCKTQYKRSIIINTVTVTRPGNVIAGINSNYGDTAALRIVTIVGDSSRSLVPCQRYIGNNTGKEPTKDGSGPDSHCNYTAADLIYR